MTKQNVNNQRYLVITAALLLTGLMLYVLRSVLLPFVVGILVAYFLDPLVNRITKYCKISRSWASVALLFLVLLILLPLLVLAGSIAFSQISEFAENLPMYLQTCKAKMFEIMATLHNYFPALSWEKAEEFWRGNAGDSLKPFMKVVQKIISNGFAFINVISLLLISPVVAFYMLRDWHDFTRKIYDLVPKKHKKTVTDGVKQIDRIISGYLRGQFMVCVALGTFYSCGLWLVDLNLGILIGFLAGLISFIPYVGSISGFLMAMVLVVTQYGTWPKIAEVILVFVVGQFIEGNFLTPRLVGENIGLHPVWVMFALLSGGVLLGLLGMIIAVPLAACIGVFLRYLIENYKKSAIYLEG